ncbi:A/G-specific adenine glycosylase [Arhodomonas aquaeolei]|uniref:A/G-specific adenine glycosylase n=1 Tax=Arhodomonas TaxID=2368 RepID=UPI0013D3AEF0|nr:MULTISPECIES: A/G-specific adenine glycosylase [Arhodomonas]MCS4503070.1 A/G-specific adenine glycosylase [Arhodomonas aquaeolei]
MAGLSAQRDAAAADVATRVVEWFDVHGRHDLPWQRPATPYRVWVSEVMLQQTQVTTVIPYFERFMARFPDVHALASADVDEVLHLWSGLGYYARARNLHRAAQRLVEDHGGEFPAGIDAVESLPGIGRSTAGAILSLSRGERHPILDGNVKRVLARYHGIDGWPGRTAVARELWAWSEAHTPDTRPDAFNQAMMDMGATVCLRRRPLCGACPLASDCHARAAGTPEAFPGRRPKRDKPVRATRMLLITRNDGRVLLQRRPPTGIWGGLWCPPECDVDTDPAEEASRRFGLTLYGVHEWRPLRHVFTHFALDIHPVRADAGPGTAVMDDADLVWYNAGSGDARGLAAPVARLLKGLEDP